MNHTRKSKIHASKLLRSLALLVICCQSLKAFAQQDPHYTQFWNIPVSYNPATSGLFYKQQAGLNYRREWGGYSGAPNNILFSYNARLDQYKSGVGLNYGYQKIEEFSKNQLMLNYSYHLKVGEEKVLAFGASVGFTQLSFKPYYFTEHILGYKPGSGAAFSADFGIAFKTKRLALAVSFYPNDRAVD